MAVSQIKDCKAPSTDDIITSDVFKIGGEGFNKQLVNLYNKILHDIKAVTYKLERGKNNSSPQKGRQSRYQELQTHQSTVP